MAGDFNGDKYADLAVGVPGQKVGGHAGAGAVHIFYGSADGFISVTRGVTHVNDAVWHRDSPDVRETAEAGDSLVGRWRRAISTVTRCRLVRRGSL